MSMIADFDPWPDIRKAIERYRNWEPRSWKFGGHDFLPVPYVNRVLRELHRERPEGFCLMVLKWSAEVPDSIAVRTFALPLPLHAPEEDSLKSALDLARESDASPDDGWWNERLVVARCAAAAWVNLRMLLGPGRLEIEFRNAKSGEQIDSPWKKWIEAIKWVQQQDNHDTLRAFLLQVGCARYLDLADQGSHDAIPHRAAEKSPRVLGIDIGGTSIKWGLFGPSVSGGYPWPPIRQGALRTQREFKFKDGQDFCQYVFSQIKPVLDEEGLNPKSLCVGITWPGPVRGKAGREYVAGPSGIMGNFERLSSTITANSPDAIHALKIREGFVGLFGDCVRLINDGDGHVIFARSLLKASTVLSDKRLMVMVAGTGTALGLIEGGAIAPFLSEVGKTIINLVEPFLACQKDRGGNFPAGVANQLFSEKTNPRIAKDLVGSAVSNREVSWLYKRWNQEECPSEEAQCAEELFARLPEQLEWIGNDQQRKTILWQARRDYLDEKYLTVSDISGTCTLGCLLERASWLAADLIAMCADVLKANAVYLSGGPITAIGAELSRRAKEHLKTLYGFDTDGPDAPHAINGLEFLADKPQASMAAMGAAKAAWEIFASPRSELGGDTSVREIDPVFLA